MAAKVGQVIVDFLLNTAKFESDIKKATRSFKSMGRDLMDAGKTLTAGITLPIVGAGAAAIKLAGDFEQTTIAFETMLGSSQEASAFLKDLEGFASRTPFEFNDLVNASKRMMALGFSAEQVIPIMTTIGDSVSALGGGAEVIDRVTLALGQMQAKGKVSAQEMNQLAEVGIPAWQLLADSIGKSIPEAMKLAEKGAISASVAVPAILDGMNERFAGSMEKQSKTLLGQWSNVKDQLFFTLRDLGTVLLPIAMDVMDNFIKPLIEGIKGLAEWFADLPGPVKTAMVVVAGMAAAMGPLLMVIGAVSTGIGTLIPMLPKMVLGIKGITAAMGPWGLAIAAVTTLVLTFHNEIEDAIVSFVRWIGLAEQVPEVTSKNEVAYKRVANELKISTATMDSFTKSNKNALMVLGQHKTEIAELQKKLASGQITQAQYETELRKLIETTPKASKVTHDLGLDFDDTAKKTKDLVKEIKDAYQPFDELTKQIQEEMKVVGDTAPIKRHYDAIIKSATEQQKYGYKLTEVQVKLLEEAYAFKRLTDATDDADSAFSDLSQTSIGLIADLDKLRESSEDAFAAIQDMKPSDLFKEPDVLFPELDKFIVEAPEKFDEATDKCGGSMNDLGREVSTTLTNMTQDLAESLTRWAGKFQSFAKAALSSLLEGLFNPLMKKLTSVGNAIGDWLGGLLGGKGGGGLLSSIGSALGLGGTAAASTGAGAAGAGAGAAGGGGLMSSVGGFLTNPWTIGIGAGALGAYGLYKLFDKDAWESGKIEAARDFGGVNYSEDAFKGFAGDLGLNEKQTYGIRKDLMSSPQMLINILGPLAEAQGKSDAFLKSLESIQTSWGTFDFRDEYELGKATGDWSALNNEFIKAFQNSQALAEAMPNWQDLLSVAGQYNAMASGLQMVTAPAETAYGESFDKVPAYASGTNYVPQDMLAYVHRGEAIIPAGQNRPGSSFSYQGGNIQHVWNFYGVGAQELEQVVKSKIIPILNREAVGGNTGYREALRRSYAITAGAY